MHQPVPLPRGQGFVSASIGLSIYPLDGDTPDLLLRQADHAMYEAKQNGKNHCRRFAGSEPMVQAPLAVASMPMQASGR